MILFIRAWYGLLGVVGKILYFFVIRIHEKRANKKFVNLSENCSDKEMQSAIREMDFGFDFETYSEIVRICSEYRDNEMAKIKTIIPLSSQDEIDLNHFFYTIKFISLRRNYR